MRPGQHTVAWPPVQLKFDLSKLYAARDNAAWERFRRRYRILSSHPGDLDGLALVELVGSACTVLVTYDHDSGDEDPR